MRLVEKEELNEEGRERERTEGRNADTEEREGRRKGEKCFGEPTGTPDSKYPPDTLHLSLPFPPLAISRLTHRPATKQKGDGERDREEKRTIDLSRNASRTGDRLKSL